MVRRLRGGEGEVAADFVAGAGGREETLVEVEGGGDKAGECGLALDAGLERGEAGGGLGAGEGDVGAVGAGFGEEAAGTGGGGDELLKGEERRRGVDAEDEHGGAIEAGEGVEVDGNGGGAHGVEGRGEARVLGGRGLAEELERNVPGFGPGPPEAVTAAAEAGDKGGELGGDFRSKRDGDEEAHGVVNKNNLGRMSGGIFIA